MYTSHTREDKYKKKKKQMEQRKQSQFDLYYVSGKMAHKTAYPKG